jgi:hypothetical protein
LSGQHPSDITTAHVGFDTFCDAFEPLELPSDQIKVTLEPS